MTTGVQDKGVLSPRVVEQWREMEGNGENWVVRVRERKRRESGVYDSDEERGPPPAPVIWRQRSWGIVGRSLCAWGCRSAAVHPQICEAGILHPPVDHFPHPRVQTHLQDRKRALWIPSNMVRINIKIKCLFILTMLGSSNFRIWYMSF